jgi:hypothetical protein
MTSMNIDEIAGPAGGNAWKPEIGDIAKGEITYLAKQSPKLSYDKKKMEQSVRIDLVEGDVTVNVYIVTNTDIEGGGYPKRNARAVAAAVRSAGATELEVGGYLAIQRVDDVPTEFQPAQDFVAEYRAPKPAGMAVASLLGPADTAAAPSLKSLIGD